MASTTAAVALHAGAPAIVQPASAAGLEVRTAPVDPPPPARPQQDRDLYSGDSPLAWVQRPVSRRAPPDLFLAAFLPSARVVLSSLSLSQGEGAAGEPEMLELCAEAIIADPLAAAFGRRPLDPPSRSVDRVRPTEPAGQRR